jgi:hypothetical protein
MNKNIRTKTGQEQKPKLVVQQIYTYWTKHSRGNPAASQRNAVPEVLPLDSTRIQVGKLQTNVVYHLVSFREQNSFQPNPEYILQDYPTLRYGCVAADIKNDEVIVVFRYNGTYGGAPTRDSKPQTFIVALNKWMQIIENGRFSDESSWSYQKVVTNVGMFTTVTDDLFTHNAPYASFQNLEELW